MAHAHFEPARVSTWPAAGTAALRVAFGIVWAINAALAWRGQFADHFVGYLHNAAQGQPGWLAPWFTFWIDLVSPNVDLFVWLVRIAETLLALALLLGFARKTTYVLGALFSLLIWATAEGFGGPYATGVTNISASIIYVLVFLALILIDRGEGRNPYSVDFYLEQRWPRWRLVSEWASGRTLERVPPRLPWYQQILAIIAIAVVLALLIGSLQSATTVAAPTPPNAAAAVTPLQLASSEPVANPRDATLPPLMGTGDEVSVTLTATDVNVTIASGVEYQAWTFNDEAPGPVIHVRQGQTVHVTFTNNGTIHHSLDFHAAIIDASVAYRDIQPGETINYSFVAETPGVFLYHCGTAPVLFHIANGMYGAIVVDPAEGLPPADASYVLVQSEWYTKQAEGNTMAPDYTKMLSGDPDVVAFNGIASQYRDHPLQARAGERVRIYFVNAGPTLYSAFHVIGGMFQAVYQDADPSHALTGVSTFTVAPGQGVVFDLVLPAGTYTFVDHSMRAGNLGATGFIEVTP